MAKYIETKSIPVDQIELAPWHPRKDIEKAQIEEIGENIAEKGQMQSIRVTPRDSKYLIAFGGRRVSGAKLKGLQEIRAEVWELTDLELINDQARELIHTASLDGSPDIDAFFRFAFHHNVEEKISLFKLNNEKLPEGYPCPQCYNCPLAQAQGREGCPTFISQTEFAEKIIGNVSQGKISSAIHRDMIRNEIPEIAELAKKPLREGGLPSPSATLPILWSLLEKHWINRGEAIALAEKAAQGLLGGLTEEQKKHGWGPVKTLEIIGTFLRKKDKEKIPDKVRERLIYWPNYGPAEAEEAMKKKTQQEKSDEDRFTEVMKAIETIAATLGKFEVEGKLEQFDLQKHSIAFRLLADFFTKLANQVEGRTI